MIYQFDDLFHDNAIFSPHPHGVAPQIPGDFDGDGIVGIIDLLTLLAAWGPCSPPCPPSCAADLDGDSTVGITDLLSLLSQWSS